jgi:hypothetical protein
MTNDTVREASTVVIRMGHWHEWHSERWRRRWFTCTPDSRFSGTDTFIYAIMDVGGDNASATATLTVGNPVTTRTLDLSTSKIKGSNTVILNWTGFTSNVSISRNGLQVTNNEPNEGSWQDNLCKGISGTYDYRVCDTQCGKASITF